MRCPNPECPDIEKYGIPGEYTEGFVVCPKCGVDLEENEEIEEQLEPDYRYQELVALYSPLGGGELALVQSILENAEIPFYVRNHFFGSLHPGPDIELFNRRTVMVPEDRAGEAVELIGDYLQVTSESPLPVEPRDRTRQLLEFLCLWIAPPIGAWFVPGRMRSRKNYDLLPDEPVD